MGKEVADPLSPWFVAAEEQGEFVGIRYGRVPVGATEPEWIFMLHYEADGIGSMARIFRDRGVDLPHLPQIKHPSEPSSFSILQSLPKFLRPKKKVSWGELAGKPQPSTSTEPPPAVAWHVFDEAASVQIRRVCRRAGVTVNSFLVKHLTKAIRPYLADQSSVVPWMLPVNVRGKVDLGRDTANHTSYITVKVRSYETVADIHHNIYQALGKGEHWANWQSYVLCRPLSHGIKKYLLASGNAMPEWYMGSFSNLGDWDPEKKITQPDCQGAWLFAPPVLRCQHLGAGCITFQNQLGLTIQAHPELTNSAEDARNWMNNWVKEIEIDLASVMARPM